MGKKSYRQNDVQCPFFRDDDGKRRITCEGLIEGSTLALLYRNRRDFELQMQVFCCEHYRKCEIHRMLMEKYE